MLSPDRLDKRSEGKEKGAMLIRSPSNRIPPGGRGYRISLSCENLSIMSFTKPWISSYR